MYEFCFEGDYKASFAKAVDDLIVLDLPLDFRIGHIDLLIEAYFHQTGHKPDAYQLERLANYILKEDLTDPHPDKVTRTEYPILNEGQYKLRSDRERSGGDVSWFPNNESRKQRGRKKSIPREAF